MRLGQLKGTVSRSNPNFDTFKRENHSWCWDSVLWTSHDATYNWSACSLRVGRHSEVPPKAEALCAGAR